MSDQSCTQRLRKISAVAMMTVLFTASTITTTHANGRFYAIKPKKVVIVVVISCCPLRIVVRGRIGTGGTIPQRGQEFPPPALEGSAAAEIVDSQLVLTWTELKTKCEVLNIDQEVSLDRQTAGALRYEEITLLPGRYKIEQNRALRINVRTIEGAAENLDGRKFGVGGQFSSLNTRRNSATEPGVGGWLSYDVLNSVALEAEANFSSRESPVSELGGGRVTQALLGPKAGKRYERFGLFGTVKPGVHSYSRTVTGFRFDGERLTGVEVGRKNLFALKLGGVVELYPSGRLTVRFDGGDIITRQPSRLTVLPQSRVARAPAFSEHNLQLSYGLGYRF